MVISLRSQLTCIVPTAGRSPYLSDCLRAVRSGVPPAIVVVAPVDASASLRHQIGDLPVRQAQAGAGFASACNLALAQVETEFVALLNDDAVVEPDWADTLLEALAAEPSLAAVQGANRRLLEPGLVDGCGLAWNRRWQAVQIGRLDRWPPAGRKREIFGVSATAAMFRMSALRATALAPQRFFEPHLETYYEDVELACRLRAAGFRSLCVPAAVANHAGSVSSSDRRAWRYQQIYGNRLLVLARLLGDELRSQLPEILARDLADLLRGILRTDGQLCAGILRGWSRAWRLRGRFTHRGAPMVSRAELERFVVGGTERSRAS